MKKSVNIFIYILLVLFIFSCKEDLEVKTNPISESGRINIQFTLSEDEYITITKGDDNLGERLVNSLTLLIFNSEGTKILQREDVDVSIISNINQEGNNRNTFTYSFLLAEEAKEATNLIFYALANVKTKGNNNIDLISEFQTGYEKSISDLEEVTSDVHYGIENGFIMSGKTEGLKENSLVMNLYRTCAKLTLKDNSHNNSFILHSFKVLNTATKCYLTAKQKSNPFYDDNSRSPISGGQVKDNDGSFRYDCYVHPTKTHTQENNLSSVKTLVMVDAEWMGKQCYYAFPIYNKNESDMFYNLLPNHWYEMVITEIKGYGYSSEEEALENLTMDRMEVDIHDHAEKVSSIISDGIRELGVTSQIEIIYNNDKYNPDFVPAYLTVKCYSYNDKGITEETKKETNTKPVITIKEGEDWIKIINKENPVKINDTDEISGNHSEDLDNPGVRWKYTLNVINGENIFNDKEALLEVEWQGLKREVKIFYNAIFSPQSICDVTLNFGYINSTDYPRSGEHDYWELINSQDKHINGIDSESLTGGKIRNEGFHFPMPYGESEDKQWTYYYTLDFSKLEKEIETIDIITSGDDFFDEINLNWKYPFEGYHSKGQLSLKEPKKNDFTYATGKISFIITLYPNREEIILSTDLYHTGFIDYNSAGTQTGIYYEVVDLGGYYWLDRNIAATSNLMYVDNGDSSVGDARATGYFYKIANKGQSYTDPSFKYDKICPPGYTIPNNTDWDNIRLSPNFKSSQENDGIQSYISTYFETLNDKIGKVYFPKSRFYSQESELNSDNSIQYKTIANAGDPGSGYYWTSSISSGLEKQEIGCWLNALNLSGSSNTFINGSIKNQMMNVRCISKYSHSEDVKYSIDFNVKGATHVYLYKLDESGNKNGIFSFPGKTIGSQSSVDALDDNNDESYLHFAYTSSIPSEDLYVFFAYKTDQGTITLLTENGNQTISEATGWPVKVGYNYFFDKDLNPIYKGNEFPWIDKNENEAEYYFTTDYVITIYWPQLEGFDAWMIYCWDEFYNDITSAFPGNQYSGYISPENNSYYNVQAYYYTFPLKFNCNNLYVILNRNSKDIQSYNIEIKENSPYVKILEKDLNRKEIKIVLDETKIRKK